MEDKELKLLFQPLRVIREAVKFVLSEVGWVDIQYSIEEKSITLGHGKYGHLTVNQLSDGIQAVFALVADLAYRCYLLNNHLGDEAIKQTPGIILIDEVDMHLHPKWQQTILTQLRTAFPKIQFIVTTHSPQVLSTVAAENIRLIEQDENGDYRITTPEFSPLAHESGTALAQIMDTQREPPLPIQDDIRRYEQLVRAGEEESSEAQNLRQQLEEKGYQFHPSDLDTWRFLATLKDKQHG